MNLPTVGPTGSKVVGVDMRHQISPLQVMHYGPPAPPLRARPVYDEDDDIVDYVTIGDDELARLTAAYELASAEWARTNGTFLYQAEPDRWSCKVTCEDGTTATAIGDGETWQWTAWQTVESVALATSTWSP